MSLLLSNVVTITASKRVRSTDMAVLIMMYNEEKVAEPLLPQKNCHLNNNLKVVSWPKSEEIYV